MMKIGILGTGRITDSVVPVLLKLPEIECYAVASRTLEKAEAFRNKYGFVKAYGSYEEMMSDPQVELIYVASPHSHHYEYMMQCMKHGKAVISEKAFTVNAKQAEKIKEYSENNKIFAAEAIWTRYMPSKQIINDVIESGIIGDVQCLTANLFYNVGHRERLRKPELAGGALLDVGIYGINFALMHFGTDIEKIESSVQLMDTGVDAVENITFFYKDGRTAFISAGITARSDRQGIFYGTKGYIVVDNINNPIHIKVYDDSDHLLEERKAPDQINGYEYEFIESVKAIHEGRTETWSMPLEDTVFVMKLMDRIRSQWGLTYPEEIEKV